MEARQPPTTLRLPRFIEVETSRHGPSPGDRPRSVNGARGRAEGANGRGPRRGGPSRYHEPGGNGAAELIDADADTGGHGELFDVGDVGESLEPGSVGSIGGVGTPGQIDDGDEVGEVGEVGELGEEGLVRGPGHDGRGPWQLASVSVAAGSGVRLMSWALFDKIVGELGELGYSGWWAFHHCCEPLLNPRLVRELQHVRRLVPEARTMIHTNGDLLTSGLLVDLLCLGAGYVRITRYPRPGADEPPDQAIHQWLLAGGLLDFLPWQFSETRYGWAATYDQDGLRVDVIRPRLPARAAASVPGQNLPLSSTLMADARSPVASIDCSGQVAMCRNVFGDQPTCGRHTIGNVRERSFADLWSSPTRSTFHANDGDIVA